jgi:hypothetical protein
MTTHPVPTGPGGADVPPVDPDRSAKIAAIFAYADFLQRNPNVPVPTDISGSVHPRSGSGDSAYDAPESRAAVKAFIDDHGAVFHTSGNTIWSTLRVVDIPGVHVEHVIFAELPKAEPGEWWSR